MGISAKESSGESHLRLRELAFHLFQPARELDDLGLQVLLFQFVPSL